MRNRYKVPTKQWNKWNEKGKKVFNYTYKDMLFGRRVIPPNPIKYKDWRVIAWNTAWLIADRINGIAYL